MIHNKTTVKTHVEVTLDREAILALLTKDGYDLTNATNISVSFTVPRGGDYSGMTIEIDEADPIKVFWTSTSAF